MVRRIGKADINAQNGTLQRVTERRFPLEWTSCGAQVDRRSSNLQSFAERRGDCDPRLSRFTFPNRGDPTAMRTEAQRLKIRNAFLEQAAPVEARRAWTRLRELRARESRVETAVTTVMVMQELPEPRPAYVLKRGSYDARGERVDRGVPAVLPPMAKDWPNNRLGFARWLVSPDNPLTSRVTVNRFWQMLFGTGLVKTVEDFGAQGEAAFSSRVARLAGGRVSAKRLERESLCSRP